LCYAKTLQVYEINDLQPTYSTVILTVGAE